MRRIRTLGFIMIVAVVLCAALAFCACDKDDEPNDVEEVPDFRIEDYAYFELGEGYAESNKIVIKKIKDEYKDTVTEMVIPDTCTSIYGGAFEEMKNLRKVTIPNVRMGIGVFQNCTKLNEIVFSDDVEWISEKCFAGCSSLENVVLPPALKGISADSFSGTSWFNSQPDGIVYIGNIAYAYKGDMPKDTTITFRDGTKVIADWFFRFCNEVVEVIMPDSVEFIGIDLFTGCEKLRNVRFSENITHATRFFNCPSIREVVFPDKVETLYSNTFYNCVSLMSVTIGKNYKKTIIGWFEPVVQHCPRLVQIYNRSNGEIESLSYCDGIYFYSKEGEGKLVETEKDTYYLIQGQEKRFVGYFGDEIETFSLDADTTEVTRGAFYDSKVKHVILPEGVKKIGEFAFGGDSLVETITMPSSIEEVDYLTFEDFFYESFEDPRVFTVYYDGTMAQWDAVVKFEYQMSSRVICKDGTISLNKECVPF